MKKIKKVLIILSNVALVILIIAGIFIGITLLPLKNNFKILSVMSGSMKPTIDVGSLAVIKPAADYKVGDIITFRKPNASSDRDATTHRIIEVLEVNGSTFYKTKGDANENADTALVNRDQVVGKYYFSIAFLGYLIKYLKTLPGLVLIIIIPATIIIYEEVRKIIREVRGMKAGIKMRMKEKKKRLNKSPKKEKK